MRWRFLPLFFGLLWLGGGICAAAEEAAQRLEKERARARELQREKDKARKELMKTLQSEKQVMGHLDRIDRELDRRRRESKKLRQDIVLAQSSLNEAQAQTDALRKEIAALERIFHRRLVALYKTQRAGYPALILSARSPQEALRTYHYLFCIARQDAHSLQRVRSKVAEWERAKAFRRERKALLFKLQKDNFEQQRMIRLQKAQKHRVLAALKDRKELQGHALREFEEASDKLQGLIRSLEEASKRESKGAPATPKEAKSFEQLKGNLPLPVPGEVRTGFGKQFHPFLKTYMVHNGIEIGAPEGEAIKAVHSGQVVFSGWLRGYGNVLIIDHGGGYYSLSGHASRILKEVGERVDKGDVIGYVGDTGSLGGPSLYFEIRKGVEPLNPLEWCRSRREQARVH